MNFNIYSAASTNYIKQIVTCFSQNLLTGHDINIRRVCRRLSTERLRQFLLLSNEL